MAEFDTPSVEPLQWHQPAWRWFDNATSAGRLPQAMLLTGGRGLGKRLFARQLVKLLLVDADNVAEEQRKNRLKQLEAGSHADFRQLNPAEGKQIISVDQIRELTTKAMLTSRYGGARVILIEPAEAMNTAAANALLKCLEEPPAGTVFILVSDQPARLPITIRSRCQVVNFQAPAASVAMDWLAEQGVNEANAAIALTLAGNGPLRAMQLIDADTINSYRQFSQALEALTGGKGNPVSAAATLLPDGRDVQTATQLCDWINVTVSQLLKVKLAVSPQAGKAELSPVLQQFAESVAHDDAFKYLERVSSAKIALTGNASPLLTIESILAPWSRKLRVV